MVRDDRRRTYKGTIFKNQPQADAYDDIAIWGLYTPTHDPDSERAGAGTGHRNEAFWKRKLGDYAKGLVSSKQYETINEIADEDDLDNIRGMSEDRKRKSAKAKTKRKTCKCRK